MDWNVIQAPEIIRRLRNRLGLVQAHITPTLNEGVQAVVLLDDMSREPATGAPEGFQSAIPQLSVAVGAYGACSLYPNIAVPPTKRARLRSLRISLSGAGSIHVIGGLCTTTLGGYSSILPVPKSGAVPPGSSQWQFASSQPPFATWAGTIVPNLTEFVDEMIVGDALAGVTTWSKEWGDNGPTLPAGSANVQFIFGTIDSHGLPFSAWCEWDEL